MFVCGNRMYSSTTSPRRLEGVFQQRRSFFPVHIVCERVCVLCVCTLAANAARECRDVWDARTLDVCLSQSRRYKHKRREQPNVRYVLYVWVYRSWLIPATQNVADCIVACVCGIFVSALPLRRFRIGCVLAAQPRCRWWCRCDQNEKRRPNTLERLKHGMRLELITRAHLFVFCMRLCTYEYRN